jgi:hypothetical protein
MIPNSSLFADGAPGDLGDRLARQEEADPEIDMASPYIGKIRRPMSPQNGKTGDPRQAANPRFRAESY